MNLLEPLWVVSVSAHLTVVAKLITLLFTLMRADDELQVVSVQEVLCDVGAPVAASAPHLVGCAAILGHWIAPQQVQDLEAVRSDKRERFNFEMKNRAHSERGKNLGTAVSETISSPDPFELLWRSLSS